MCNSTFCLCERLYSTKTYSHPINHQSRKSAKTGKCELFCVCSSKNTTPCKSDVAISTGTQKQNVCGNEWKSINRGKTLGRARINIKTKRKNWTTLLYWTGWKLGTILKPQTSSASVLSTVKKEGSFFLILLSPFNNTPNYWLKTRIWNFSFLWCTFNRIELRAQKNHDFGIT